MRILSLKKKNKKNKPSGILSIYFFIFLTAIPTRQALCEKWSEKQFFVF